MSIVAREALVAKLVFQDASQRSDLLDPNLTQTQMIEGLTAIAAAHHIEVTAVRSDHHDDGEGPGYHGGGWAIDCWPLADAIPGNYLDASTQAFRDFLKACATAPCRMQVGLGGSAWSDANVAATGLSLGDASVFEDDGQDHVHIGFRP
jgi:hypothetical protein